MDETSPSHYRILQDSHIVCKPRLVSVERKRPFDERSFSENSFRIIDHLENLSPAGRRSGYNTPSFLKTEDVFWKYGNDDSGFSS
ncbi:hypothetical protein SADUNF_Sadunf05G0181200 [Salix dunnii]|uniref:Uncharacterized protein n=1 Tax=Salix dunnii TaxID=1413687 RepID=A0A835K917_9ROSI|nr:hypothetical protein SADUNF_Sadunf05G0181200 [Salix dunnii]